MGGALFIFLLAFLSQNDFFVSSNLVENFFASQQCPSVKINIDGTLLISFLEFLSQNDFSSLWFKFNRQFFCD